MLYIIITRWLPVALFSLGLIGCVSSYVQFFNPAITDSSHSISGFKHTPAVIQVNLQSNQPGLFFRLWSFQAKVDYTDKAISVPLFDNFILGSNAPPHQLVGNKLVMPVILDMIPGTYTVTDLHITDLTKYASSNPDRADHKPFPLIEFTVAADKPVFFGQWNIHVLGIDKVGDEFIAKMSFSFVPGNEADFAALRAQFPALDSRSFSFSQLQFN